MRTGWEGTGLLGCGPEIVREEALSCLMRLKDFMEEEVSRPSFIWPPADPPAT